VVQVGQPNSLSEHWVTVHGPGQHGKAAIQSSHEAKSQPVPVAVPVVVEPVPPGSVQ